MAQEIYIIDNDNELKSRLVDIFKKEKEYKFKKAKTTEIESVLKNIPALIIINEDGIQEDIIQLCNQIRENEDNSITPIIVISSRKEKEHRVEILKACVEHYIKAPIDEEYLYYTIKNVIRLLDTNRRVSPLTGLPGNVQIQAEMKKRLLNKEEFAILYIDLDNFKAYNDVYGFLNGDEIIKFTSRCILKHVHDMEAEGSFVGHIGGDDFVAIVSNIECEHTCQDIVLEFESGVKKYFNEEDVEKGYLEVPNRKCILEQFPLTTISIGVVIVDQGRFHNVLEIGEVAAQVKHLAKITPGSTYIIDRRKNGEEVPSCSIPKRNKKIN